MNAIAVMYVNSHLEDLRVEAHRNRTASLAPKRSMRERISSAAASLRNGIGSESEPSVPQLKDYPYGG